MKPVFLIGMILFSLTVDAQTPQYAVVRPDGTTYICPTFDSAHTKAVDDDVIYMPGTTISGDKTITKRLTLIGAGHYPDSTGYTGKTTFSGNLFLGKRCTLEGFQVSSGIAITNSDAANCAFIRITTSSINFGGTNNHYIDGSVVNFITASAWGSTVCNQSSDIFIKNSILFILERLQYSSIINCIFLGNNFGFHALKTANSIFSNCIFRGVFGMDWQGQAPCFALAGNINNNCINPVAAGQNNYSNNQPIQ